MKISDMISMCLGNLFRRDQPQRAYGQIGNFKAFFFQEGTGMQNGMMFKNRCNQMFFPFGSQFMHDAF